MNMLAIILLQVGCVRDLSTIGLCLRMRFKIRIIQRLSLTMPVLAIAGGYIPTFGGNTTMPSLVEYGINLLAQNVTGITVPNSGHYIAEEQPDVVVKLLNNFFRSNSTTA